MRSRQKLEFHTFEQVFGKLLKSKGNREKFDAEMARRRLVFQIRELRRSKKLTQRTFAKKVGMPQSVIARMETGKHQISLSTLVSIASAFGKQVKLV
ncbi:MAG: helix-turn-helix transcriptional regulator [Patescibacteria group bacterium]|nr:helix-turn-helix transcriptional regulator [Patescibacteria group bacterium]